MKSSFFLYYTFSIVHSYFILVMATILSSLQHETFRTILLLVVSNITHYANTPIQYTAIFHGCKNVHFQMNYFNVLPIFAQNIDCGYTLELPQ